MLFQVILGLTISTVLESTLFMGYYECSELYLTIFHLSGGNYGREKKKQETGFIW